MILSRHLYILHIKGETEAHTNEIMYKAVTAHSQLEPWTERCWSPAGGLMLRASFMRTWMKDMPVVFLLRCCFLIMNECNEKVIGRDIVYC